ncbi:hypothetical protein JAAARDRAFT_199772 [Jaapia argillacea MUCL 33604]|uniref:Uncharacterized protein n=1 Tax=Jaapia argillacea MUCL 33604 TaxID=933084 RepID=A0A067P9Y7_9AGAM|nr:hypothetical protein JAAARDRAFT_199772 [Jaapia argillacea MUCL 33604]
MTSSSSHFADIPELMEHVLDMVPTEPNNHHMDNYLEAWDWHHTLRIANILHLVSKKFNGIFSPHTFWKVIIGQVGKGIRGSRVEEIKEDVWKNQVKILRVVFSPGYEVTDGFLESIGLMEGLQVLQLHGDSYWIQEALQIIPFDQLQGLQVVTLEAIEFLEGIGRVREAIGLKELKIQYVGIAGAEVDSATFFPTTGSYLENLESLTIMDRYHKPWHYRFNVRALKAHLDTGGSFLWSLTKLSVNEVTDWTIMVPVLKHLP